MPQWNWIWHPWSREWLKSGTSCSSLSNWFDYSLVRFHTDTAWFLLTVGAAQCTRRLPALCHRLLLHRHWRFFVHFLKAYHNSCVLDTGHQFSLAFTVSNAPRIFALTPVCAAICNVWHNGYFCTLAPLKLVFTFICGEGAQCLFNFLEG